MMRYWLLFLVAGAVALLYGYSQGGLAMLAAGALMGPGLFVAVGLVLLGIGVWVCWLRR